MKKKECKDYFESYIKYLIGYNLTSNELLVMKKHIKACEECQERLFMLIDILDEHLLGTTLEPDLSFNYINLFFNDLTPVLLEASLEIMIEYLFIYRLYRDKVIDILPFDSKEELYDFYENKLMPAFDSQNEVYNKNAYIH